MGGRNIFMGYVNMEEKTRETFTDDWMLKSGDIGTIDEDGFLFITGRFKGEFKPLIKLLLRRSRVQSILMNMSVCLFVCLSVSLTVCICLHTYLSNHTFKFLQILCARCLWPWFGLFLHGRIVIMYFRFCR